MIARVCIVAWFLGIVTVATSPAFAQGAYFQLGAGVMVLHLPENTFFADREEGGTLERRSNLDVDDGVLSGAGLEALAGLPLGPVFGLDDTAVELHGSFAQARNSSSVQFTDPGAGPRYGWVQLDNSAGFGTPDGFTLETAIDRSALFIEGEVLLKGRLGQVEFFAGPAVRGLRQNVDISGEITTTVALSETLNTDYGGLLVGGSVDVIATSDLLLNLRGSIAALAASTQYDATYLDSISPERTASLTDSRSALEVKARVTLEKHISPNTTIGAYAAGTYLSYAPQVNYGSVPTDPSNGVLRLEGAPMWGAGFGVTFRQVIN